MLEAYLGFHDQLAELFVADPGVIAAFGDDPVIVDLTHSHRRFPSITLSCDLDPADRVDVPACEAAVSVSVWTRETGDDQCRKISFALADLLHVDGVDLAGPRLNLTGLRVVRGKVLDVRFLPDPKANIRHGLIRAEYRIAPQAI